MEKPDGQQFRLDKMTPEDRAAKAKLLLNEPGYKVRFFPTPSLYLSLFLAFILIFSPLFFS